MNEILYPIFYICDVDQLYIYIYIYIDGVFERRIIIYNNDENTSSTSQEIHDL